MGRSKDIASGSKFVDATGDTMSGDLTIDTNTFHVDVADNRVGIGTTAPAQPLHVFKAGSQGGGLAPLIKIQNDTNNLTGDGAGIEFHGKYQGGEWGFGKIGGTNSGGNFGGSLEFHTNTGTGSVSTGFTKKMTIDRNGYVTMPNQPSFSATGNFGWRDYNSYSEVPTWTVSQSKSHNVGGHFNTTSGRFTAPVAGRYQFNLIVYVNNTGEEYHNSKLYINGSKYADNVLSHQSSSSNAYDNTTAGSYVVSLASGDYVSLYHINDIYGYHTTFSGYLLG